MKAITWLAAIFAIVSTFSESAFAQTDTQQRTLEILQSTKPFSTDGLAKFELGQNKSIYYTPITVGEANNLLIHARKKIAGSGWQAFLATGPKLLNDLKIELDSSKTTESVIHGAQTLDLNLWFAKRQGEGRLKMMSNDAGSNFLRISNRLDILGVDPGAISREDLLTNVSSNAVAISGGSSTDTSTGITTTVMTSQIQGHGTLSMSEKNKIVDETLSVAREARIKDDAREIIICFIQISEAWQIPAFFRNSYIEQRVPLEVQVALLKQWHEKYGADLAALSNNGYEVLIEKIPSPQDLKPLSRELALFCPDLPANAGNNWHDFDRWLQQSTVWSFT